MKWLKKFLNRKKTLKYVLKQFHEYSRDYLIIKNTGGDTLHSCPANEIYTVPPELLSRVVKEQKSYAMTYVSASFRHFILQEEQ